MKYYIDTNKELFGVEQGQEFLIQPDWVEVSLEEIEAMNKAKEDEYKSSVEYKVQEALAYLASTDYITAKYNDLVTISGSMSKADFIAKYKAIYDARDEARKTINEVH